MYLIYKQPSLLFSSSLIAATNLPLHSMSSFVYKPLDSISVAHMHVSVEGIYKGMSRPQHPTPKPDSPFLGSYKLINPKLEGAPWESSLLPCWRF